MTIKTDPAFDEKCTYLRIQEYVKDMDISSTIKNFYTTPMPDDIFVLATYSSFHAHARATIEKILGKNSYNDSTIETIKQIGKYRNIMIHGRDHDRQSIIDEMLPSYEIETSIDGTLESYKKTKSLLSEIDSLSEKLLKSIFNH